MMKKVYINNIKIIIEDIINVKENEDEIIPLIPSYYAEKYRRIAARQNRRMPDEDRRKRYRHRKTDGRERSKNTIQRII